MMPTCKGTVNTNGKGRINDAFGDGVQSAVSQINKITHGNMHAPAQGQTIPNVGIYLPENVFSYGQLYVALSRGISRQTTRIFAKPNKGIVSSAKVPKILSIRRY
jgi:ribosomal protein S16